MYVTRRSSMLKRDPGAVSEPPLGPNSGFLVIHDEPPTYTCFGLCEDPRIRNLPFPQDKNLTIEYSVNHSTANGRRTTYYRDKVLFIPVLNQPLSSNRYYVIRRQGKHQGEASTSSKEEDMTTFLCCNFVKDVKPGPLDPFDGYQQVEIIKKSSGFQAKSTAPDGIPPEFLRRKGWKVDSSTPHNYSFVEAFGSNDSLRAQLPDFNFPLSTDSSEPVAAGKWYCPFMFVKEGMKLKEQMKNSVFYKVTLGQRWEKIFSKENRNDGGKENAVLVDVVVQTEAVKVVGREAVWDENEVVDRVLWFNSSDDVGSVGLSLEVVERMKWEQERVGWKGSNGRQERVERVEEFGGGNYKWERFGCYVLVESFVLRRMDGSLVLSYDFKHTHQIRSKWE